MKKYIYIFVIAVLGFVSCHRNEFKIDGLVFDGKGQILYLEHVGLTQINILDSCVLSEDDKFCFYCQKPEYPDLYRLRIGNQKYVFPIDSTEHISIVCEASNVSFPSQIEGSNNAIEINKLRRSVAELQKADSENDIEHFENLLENHHLYADSLIMSNTHSIVSYYAVLQSIDGYYIYNPYIKEQRVYCAAVATGFNAYMPEYIRSKSLNRYVLSAIQDEKRENNMSVIQQMVDQADEAFLEISLPDKNGEIRSLSDIKGKVVLLNFTSGSIDGYSAYVLELRELYNKYHNKGLEIYQVSGDNESKQWLKSIDNLPWICVRDKKGIQSRCFLTYNVNRLPLIYVLNRDGIVVSRHVDFATIEKDIQKCLR